MEWGLIIWEAGDQQVGRDLNSLPGSGTYISTWTSCVPKTMDLVS